MNIQRRQLLRVAASCSAAMAFLASIPAVQAAKEITIQPVAALDTVNAKWIAQELTERLADEGITVQILIPEDGIAGIPVEALVANNVQDTSIFAAARLHLEIVPTVLATGDPKNLGSIYSLATLNYRSLSHAASPEKDIAQFTALPLEYAKKRMIPFGSEIEYRPIPTLLAGKADVSVGTRFKFATVIASTSDDGNTLTINGIPLEDQTVEEATQILTAWHASTNPWADPLQSSLTTAIECLSVSNDPSTCGVRSTKAASSYRDLGAWYDGRDVGRQTTDFLQWRKMN